MAGLFERLVSNARAYINDFLEKHYEPSSSSSTAWDTAFDASPEEPASASTAESARTRTSSPLPYSDDLAQCYRTLDLPFGAPMEQVTRQWRTYLKKYHPDVHAQDAARQAEATELTRHLNDAYKKIKIAWSTYRQQR